MGIDVSKGYADFMILNSKKQPVAQNVQLDDTFEGHQSLYKILGRFLTDHPESTLFAAVESTGGYENNWYNSLIEFQGSLNIQTARLNPLGVMHNSKADLKKNTTDKISATKHCRIFDRTYRKGRLSTRRSISRFEETVGLY